MSSLTFNELNSNNISDASTLQFLEPQLSENEKCNDCAHHKNRKCELNSCNYKLKEISLYYLVR